MDACTDDEHLTVDDLIDFILHECRLNLFADIFHWHAVQTRVLTYQILRNSMLSRRKVCGVLIYC